MINSRPFNLFFPVGEGNISRKSYQFFLYFCFCIDQPLSVKLTIDGMRCTFILFR